MKLHVSIYCFAMIPSLFLGSADTGEINMDITFSDPLIDDTNVFVCRYTFER